ncbi:F0F1 ATP synthase subunit gamma [Candidatus Woesebacteria bacterium]|nr:F0F1 ATP synthase subunit gamma [Candidatus Woesebacteria bacterium]
MSNFNQLKEEISELNTISMLVGAYQDIASLRMRKVRENVLKNREFIRKLDEIFEEVRVSYAREFQKLVREKKVGNAKEITLLSHNGKTVSVLLSANTGLYGEIVGSTFRKFMNEVEAGTTEVTIVGRHGLSLFLNEGINRTYSYFDLDDYNFLPQQLDEIIRHIVQYQEIHVFYGKYVNVLKQTPEMLNVSAEIDVSGKTENKRSNYIFEPSLEKILMFFETQMFASVFDQTVRESQLAKHASRVVAMIQAEQNIKERTGKIRLEALRAEHRFMNKKQTNSLVSVYANR